MFAIPFLKTSTFQVMGNESSSAALSQFKVDESPILSAHGWSLHHAQKDDEGLTVFVDTLPSASDSLLKALETVKRVDIILVSENLSFIESSDMFPRT